jgi:ATP-dependent helicase/nuclease subunit A
VSEQLSLDGSLDPGPTEAAEAAGPTPGGVAVAPTAEQAAAIGARDRDVFLEAGAGTGKTRVLVDRYCDAVDADGVEPERILAFTFTEKAAAEMRRRVRVELMERSRRAPDPDRRTRLRRAARSGESAAITTIHGFCRRLLAAYPVAAGLDPNFRVLDAEEAARLAGLAFERALSDLAARDDAVAQLAAGYRDRLSRLIRAAYGDLRNHGDPNPQLPPLQITAFDGSEEPPDPAEVELVDASYGAIRSLLAAYASSFAAVKAERSGVDFDDLQLLAVELLEANAAIGSAYRERYEHILVDEFQDTSPLQVRLVSALRGPLGRLFVVGDENQSIYAFRGADLASFRAERQAARDRDPDSVLPLSGNFRSSPDVIAGVNAIGECLLEGFQPLRVGRSAANPPPGPPGPVTELMLTERANWKEDGIELRSAATETEPNRIAEARSLAHRLRELVDAGVDPGSMVLLLRAFSHVDAYAEALELVGLDPYVVGGRGYWSAQQVEDALCLLSCVANPLDDESLFGALASPACGAGADALWILRQMAGRKGHIWPTIRDHVLGQGTAPDESDAEAAGRWRTAAEWCEQLPAADRERIERFAGRLAGLRERAPLLALDALVEATLEAFDYDLAALALPRGERRAANLLKLVRIAAEYEAHEGRDLRGFLTYAAERAALSDREAEAAVAAEEHAGVTIMTIHAAKGLEFDCVAVADLGRRHVSPGAPPDLRLDFDRPGRGAADTDGDRDDLEPRVGLRLARAGAATLTVEGYGELNDEAAEAEAQETCRLVYVAATRARERLILSGLYDQHDIEGGRAEPKVGRSTFARLLPALGVDGSDGQTITLDPPSPRAEIEAAFEPVTLSVRVVRAGAEAAERLSADRRDEPKAAGPPPGGRPPLQALSERTGSAARSLSYAALADYQRCGYRFLTERVLGLGPEAAASGPRDAAPEPGASGRPEPDEEPTDPGPEPGAAARRRSQLGFGRAVHSLLEHSARTEWRPPGGDLVAATLSREGADPAEAERAAALVEGWLDSPLLAELRDAGARLRPELPFRLQLGAETVLRGTIDLLAEVPGQPPLVIDYKTDAAVPASEAELPEGYRIQRSLYAHAVSVATGAPEVASAYVFVAAPDRPVRSHLDGEAIAAGREQIEALIARIQGREFEATDSPHAALCRDCPARERLCPHPPERTLAPTPN